MKIKVYKEEGKAEYYSRLIDGNSGRLAFRVRLNIEPESGRFSIVSIKEPVKKSSIERTHISGQIFDFCRDQKALPCGMMLPEVALKNWISNNIVKIMVD